MFRKLSEKNIATQSLSMISFFPYVRGSLKGCLNAESFEHDKEETKRSDQSGSSTCIRVSYGFFPTSCNIWMNYNDLTVSRWNDAWDLGNHLQMAVFFAICRLVNYYNSTRCIIIPVKILGYSMTFSSLNVDTVMSFSWGVIWSPVLFHRG